MQGQLSLGQMMLCGWPGLARLWLKGNWSSLVLAVGFSILLNLAMVGTFIWPQILGESFSAIAWPLLFLVWIVSVCTSYRMIPTWIAPPLMAADSDEGGAIGGRIATGTSVPTPCLIRHKANT